MAELTFYPTVDGHVAAAGLDVDWATIRGHAGNQHDDDGTGMWISHKECSSTENQFVNLYRGILCFDTSNLPDNCIIDSAVLSIYGYTAPIVTLGAASAIVVSSNPASTSSLENGDFDSLGSVAFSPTIASGSWNASGYNDFTLNSSGKAAINKTGVSKFGIKDSYHDFSNNGAWGSGEACGISGRTTEQGTGYKPKLVVTYHIDANVNANSQSITATLLSAVVSVSATVIATLLTLTATLNASTVKVDYTHEPSTQALSLTQNASTQRIDYVLYDDAPQVITITQYSPTVMAGEILNVNSQEIILTQNTSTQKIDYSHSAGLQTITLTQNASAISTVQPVLANCQSLLLTQNAPTVKVDFVFLPDTLAISLTQNTSEVEIALVHVASLQTLSLTQYAPSYVLSQVLSPDTQTLTLTLNGISFVISQVLEVSAQSLSLFMLPELVTNPDMELDSDWANTWGASGVQSDEQAHGGTYSWKITLDADGAGGIIQNISNLIIGRTYKITGWFRGLDLAVGNFRMGLAGTTIIAPVSNGVWIKGELNWVATVTSTSLYFVVHTGAANNGKIFYVDDASVKELSHEIVIGYAPATKDLSLTQHSPSLSADQILSALTQEMILTQYPILEPAYRLLKCTFVTKKPDITISVRRPNITFTVG